MAQAQIDGGQRLGEPVVVVVARPVAPDDVVVLGIERNRRQRLDQRVGIFLVRDEIARLGDPAAAAQQQHERSIERHVVQAIEPDRAGLLLPREVRTQSGVGERVAQRYVELAIQRRAVLEVEDLVRRVANGQVGYVGLASLWGASGSRLRRPVACDATMRLMP